MVFLLECLRCFSWSGNRFKAQLPARTETWNGIMKFFDLLGTIRCRNNEIARLKEQKKEMVIRFQHARNLAEEWQKNHREVCRSRTRLEIRYRMLLSLTKEMTGETPESIDAQVSQMLRSTTSTVDWVSDNDADNSDQPIGKPFS